MRRSRAADRDQFALIAPHYDAVMANVPYGLWADYVCELAAMANHPIRPGSNVLDLATGTGSVALQFAARGCTVTGIDLSQPMINEAKRKASRQGAAVRFLCRDLADFHLPAAFDHALCLYDSLNYILEPESIKRAFANIGTALRPEGLLIFDVNTVHALEAELFTQESRPGAAVTYQWKSKYDPRTRISTIRMDFEVGASRRRFSVAHRQRGYTDAELRSCLAQGGFGRIATYEAYRFTPPGPQSDRVFYVAKRALTAAD